MSCGSVCRSCVTVTARLASTHTALVSQSLVGLCFAFPFNQCVPDRPYKILLAQVGTLSFSHPLFGVSVLFINLELNLE